VDVVMGPVEVLQRIKRVMMVLLMLVLLMLVLMTEILAASRGDVFFGDLELVVVQDSVPFLLVLVVRRGGRRRRLGVVVLRNRFFVNGCVAFLVVIGRGEDTYGNRDAGFKVQVASLSDSPKSSCRPNTT
jgi:hypothetical protein